MKNINETITLKANEGLEIEISRIVYMSEDVNRNPTWMKIQFSATEVNTNLGSCTFSEDDLEAYLKAWLENTLYCGVKSFRWVWDKYRNYKTA